MLLGLTGALLALLILNLAVLDDLRTDPSAGALETFTEPQHLSSLVAVLIAAALAAFKHRSAARVAMVVAWIEIAAFAFFHAIPVEIGPSKPYWGDGMGDALQWTGLLLILAVCHRPRHRPLIEVGRHAGRGEPAPGGGLVRALSPTAVITLRDALTDESRATRTLQLAMPSWLSIRASASRLPGMWCTGRCRNARKGGSDGLEGPGRSVAGPWRLARSVQVSSSCRLASRSALA